MAGIDFTTSSVPFNDVTLSGGLNSTGGPLSLKDNESSDLQNIDFTPFGSITKRNGYTTLNSSAISGTPDVDGLHWFEYDSSGTLTRKAIAVAGDKLFKMDDLDGTWDDITGGLTITAGNHCDFENFVNEVYITNNNDVPFKWDGTTAAAADVPTGLTAAKFVTQFNNYLLWANVTVSGTHHGSRFYWSALKDTTSWTTTHFIDVAQNDGQEITGFKVLSDRLVVYKSRSIYNVFFTGDSAIPFILPGGGKSNSEVGCAAPYSIQEVQNGHVFLSYDGFYFYDGMNSTPISRKITTTLLGYNTGRFDKAVSLVQKTKQRYWCALTTSGASENDVVLVWDYFNNAWSVYDGYDPSSLAVFYVSGTDERPYFGDYGGFVYRGDTGSTDNPAGSATAITAYYWTNWRVYSDVVDQKRPLQIVIYHQISSTTLTFGYSYDFETAVAHSQSFSLDTSADVYGTAVYGTGAYAASGGKVTRRDLKSRGRVARFRFYNDVSGETMQVDGFGTLTHLETNI